MVQTRVSPVMEDYLKAIYELGAAQPEAPVPVGALVERLKAAPATVTETVKRMAAVGLVAHTPYRGVRLTPTGATAALAVIRHHRLLERYLAEALGLPWDQVHEEADRLEHHLSEALEARIAAALGDPTSDPHGDPIPTADLTLAPGSQARLSDLPIGVAAVVERVGDQDPAKLRYLGALGLTPGAGVVVLAKSPFAGPVRLRIGQTEQVVAYEVAHALFIRSAPAETPAAMAE